jgi:dephospho-CoA kinase
MHIGLTGGIGSGKSTAAGVLVAQGWRLVDTDAIARTLTQPGGAAMPDLAERFGQQVLAADGGLDRAAMRALVFADPDAKRALEAVLHPLILAEAHAQASGASHVVFDVPLLAESRSWRWRVQRVLVIDCDPARQAQRVAQRPGWTLAQAHAVMATQASRPQRRAVADAVIDNSFISPSQFAELVAAVGRQWRTPVEESRP